MYIYIYIIHIEATFALLSLVVNSCQATLPEKIILLTTTAKICPELFHDRYTQGNFLPYNFLDLSFNSEAEVPNGGLSSLLSSGFVL